MTPGETAALAAWAFAAGADGLMFLGWLYNARTAPRLERWAADGRRGPAPRVSLLIPARDEEPNLRILMPMLDRLDWPDLEILILDDESRDATAEAAASGRARAIAGRPLPPGWLGKNWACHQLAQQATGDVLIFCDADVRLEPDAIAATLGCLRAYGADALTGLPRQIMGTWSEKAVLPVLLYMPLGYLPVNMIPKLRHPWLSIGCGQWFAFARGAYDAIGGHAAVRREVVEDLALGRLVKRKGFRLAAAFSDRLVSTRMYTDFPSLWKGFSKNMIALTGKGFVLPPLVLSAFILANVAPWAMTLLGFRAWLIPLALWLAARLTVAAVAREPRGVWPWSPIGTLLIPFLAARSWGLHRARAAAWKGRVLTAAFEGGKGNVDGTVEAERSGT